MANISEENPLILTQLSERLKEIFGNLVNLDDLEGKADDVKDSFFRTRAYSALSLLYEAEAAPGAAASCVTDGGADDGIDAVYLENSKDTIYFVQSKWRKNVKKGVELTDFTRFRDGVKAVLELRWTDDNKNLHPYKDKIESALKNIDTRVVMVLAHTSEQPIAENINSKIEDFLKEQNKFTPDFIEFREYTLKKAAQTARSHTRPENINVSVLIEQWGLLAAPYKAVYGAVSALDVVKWYDDYGRKLFAENLRLTLDKSAVNDGIVNTAMSEPNSFWYFNNGITSICDGFNKQAIGGTTKDTGVFDVQKISVINGAQTIGSLSRAKKAGADLGNVKVHIRIISLNETPEGFSISVTNANNTQNDLSAVDFVAADPNQERLRKEAIQLGVSYVFRRGEPDPGSPNAFDIRAATVAAACASGDIRLAAASKRYISGLWENTKKEPYTRLFNETVPALDLWYAVQIMKEVDDELGKVAASLTGRDRLIAVHGNRFVLFYVFEQFKTDGSFSKKDIASDRKRVPALVRDCIDKIVPSIAALFPDAYPGNIFKNQDRQTELMTAIASAPVSDAGPTAIGTGPSAQ